MKLRRSFFLSLVLFPLSLLAEIEVERPMFAGTVLSVYPTNAMPGHVGFFYLLYAKRIYSGYNSNSRLDGIENFVNLDNYLVIETGITDFLDTTLIVNGMNKYSDGYADVQYGDTVLQVAWQVSHDKPGKFSPDCRLIFSETFPTGKYQNLNPKKLDIDASGSGSYQSAIIFVWQKIFGWDSKHPYNFNLNFAYNFPSSLSVHNYNVYGGGKGTDGKAYPGQSFFALLGIEYKFNKPWGCGLNIKYQHDNKTSFKGKYGGELVGLPSSESWSLAPSIEYNYSYDLSIAVGPWFTVGGRNSPAFFSLAVDLYFSY